MPNPPTSLVGFSKKREREIESIIHKSHIFSEEDLLPSDTPTLVGKKEFACAENEPLSKICN